MDRDKLKADMERDEGYRLKAYRDSLGYWTIGIGHFLGASPRMSSITDDECEALYAWDVKNAEETARHIVPGFDTLDDVRQRACINLAFNLGGKLSEFKQTLAAIEAKDWIKAKHQLLESLWAAQVGARATRIASMIETGTDA